MGEGLSKHSSCFRQWTKKIAVDCGKFPRCSIKCILAGEKGCKNGISPLADRPNDLYCQLPSRLQVLQKVVFDFCQLNPKTPEFHKIALAASVHHGCISSLHDKISRLVYAL